ncbi:MAG: sugar phosphate nucleotidyltransferase [Sarcina sp.]
MRALILAAGKGSRISRYLSGKPKCTVDIGEITLIEDTVQKLIKKGITEIGIILGYNQNIIREVLKNYNIKFYYNPFYDVTNSIASAWFAKDFINKEEDIMIMNGDVYMEDYLLEEIIKTKESPVLFADETRKEEADYKLYYENNILKKYGKELEGEDISGEYIGVAKLNKDFIEIFLKSLEEMILTQNHCLWWENAIYNLSDKYNIYVKEIGDKFWAEVDYIEDYERILKFRNYSMEFDIRVKSI